MAAALLLIPLALWIGTFVLPPQYDETFLGELQVKRDLLAAPTEQPRIVLVGGSAVAFGIDSALIEEALPEYEVVNYGLYAALGTRIMLDLSVDDLREGDIVLVIPEQQEQTLSDDLGAAAMWQAADGDYDALLALQPSDLGAMLAAWPDFAISKFRYLLQGKPEIDGIYRRSSFNEDGDIKSALCDANVMAGGYDPTMLIDWDPDLPTDAFVDALNAYTAAAVSKGAVVWYHFPPMNAAAMGTAEEETVDAWTEALLTRIEAPLAGDPYDCVMESGWFYDTNFHLNASGKVLYTGQVIRDIKAMLADTSHTDITIPEMPQQRYEYEIAADSADALYFTSEADEEGVTLTGLTYEGLGRQTLTVPGEIDGQQVVAIAPSALAGADQLRTIIIQENITALPDALFADCRNLDEVILRQPDPTRILVGQDLFSGAPENVRIKVPEGAYDAYCLSYAWSVYADRIH